MKLEGGAKGWPAAAVLAGAIGAAAIAAGRSAEVAAAPGVWSRQWGGAATSAALVGTTAYVGIGPRLAVVDVAKPNAPRVVGLSDPAPVLLEEIAVGPGRLYAVDEKLGVLVFDIADAAHPRLIGTYKGRGDVGGAAVAGDAVLVTDVVEGVVAVNLADPANPKVLGRWDAPGDGAAQEIAASGNRAYVTIRGDDNQLVALDIANPAKMTALGEVQPPSAFMSALAVDGTRVFVADGLGVSAVDAADPARMVVRGAFEAGSMDRVAVDGGTVWCASHDGLWVIDARDMSKLRQLTALPSENGSYAVAVAGAVAVVADTDAVQVIDVGEPLADATRARFDLSDVQDLTLSDVARLGDRLVVAGGGAGLRVFDASGAAAKAVGRLSATPNIDTRSFTGAISIVGTTAYLAEDGLGGGVRIVDLADPAKPKELGAIEAAGVGRRPAALGDKVLVPSTGADALGVHVFNVADPARPRRLAFVDLGWPVAAVAVDEAAHRAFAGGSGLAILDLADPAAPKVVGTLAGVDLSGGVTAAGRWVYGASPTDGLVVIDAADPAAPRVAARLRTPGAAADPRLDGGMLVLATGAGGVLRIDIADPTRPAVTHRWATAEAAEGAVVDADGVWARCAGGIVRAIPRGAPSAPRVVAALDGTGAVLEVGAGASRLALLSGWDADRRRLAIVDPSGPEPKVLGAAPLGRLTWSLAPGEDLTFDGATAWVPGGARALAAFDARDPAAITRLTSTTPDDDPASLEHAVVVGDRGYGLTPDGLVVLDTSDPAQPKALGEKRLPDAFALAASADTVWVLSGDLDQTTLQAFDARNPRAIPAGGTWTIDGGAADLAFAAGKLYVAGTAKGLLIYAATTPRELRPLGALDFADDGIAVAVAGDRAWVAVDERPGFAVHAVDVADAAAPADLGKALVPDRQDIDLAAFDSSVAVGNALAGLYIVTYGELPAGPTATPPPPSATPSPTATAEPPRGTTPTSAPTTPAGGGGSKAYLPVSVRGVGLP